MLAAIAELEQTHDAVADLLLAESVHQLVVGQPGARRRRAGRARRGRSRCRPSPRSCARRAPACAIQHRVAIVIPDPAPAAGGRLERRTRRGRWPSRGWRLWAQGALGDPAAIAVAADGRDAGRRRPVCPRRALRRRRRQRRERARWRRGCARVWPDSATICRRSRPTWELAGLLRATLARGPRRSTSPTSAARSTDGRARAASPTPPRLGDRAAAAERRAEGRRRRGTTPLPLAAVRRPPTAPARRRSRLTRPRSRRQSPRRWSPRRSAAGRRRRAAARARPRRRRPSRAAIAELAGAGARRGLRQRLRRRSACCSAPPAGEADLWAGAVGPGGVTRAAGRRHPAVAGPRGRAARRRPSAYGETLLVREALGRRPLLRVVQTPAGGVRQLGRPAVPGRHAADGAARRAWSSNAVRSPATPTSPAQSPGVVLDEWTEVVPRRLERGDPADPESRAELVDVTTTGIALNANAPGARPPQAILVALSPDGGGWDGDRLVARARRGAGAGPDALRDAAADPLVGRVPAGAVLPRLVAAGRAGHRLGQGRGRVQASSDAIAVPGGGAVAMSFDFITHREVRRGRRRSPWPSRRRGPGSSRRAPPAIRARASRRASTTRCGCSAASGSSASSRARTPGRRSPSAS